MILTAAAIEEAIAREEITVEPWERRMLQPNGIDYYLSEELYQIDAPLLDVREPAQGRAITIGAQGLVLQPGELYLGLTMQRVGSSRYAQWLFGDRSLGSLGVWTQICAPLGHTGSDIRWTLEIRALRPVRIYAGMKFGKICFLDNVGPIQPYAGKYSQDQLTLSKMAIE